MSLILKIPLLPNTSDQTVQLEFDRNPYLLRVVWNERFQYFSLSLSTSDGVPMLTNVKMVRNYPLIGRYKHPKLPFDDFYFIQEKGAAKRPEYTDLGVNFSLYYRETINSV